MSTLKVIEVRHLSNSGTENIKLESNGTTNLQATSTLGLNVVGTLDVSGLTTLEGNVVIGDATTDTVDLKSKVTGYNNFSGFTGEIRMYAGNEGPNAPPSGWLYCNGDTISQLTGHGGTHYNADGKNNDYEALFNLLKTNSNWGNSGSPSWGTNTVKLPDFRSRSPVGVNTGAANTITSGLTARLIGATAGAQTHTLTTAELASHTHVMTNPLVSTGVTAQQSGHTHTLSAHTHTSAAHTHTTGGHSHDIAHTHDSAAHSHDLNSHTHSVPSSTTSGQPTVAVTEDLYGRSGVTVGKVAVGGDNVSGAYGRGSIQVHQHYLPGLTTGGPSTSSTAVTTPARTGDTNTANSAAVSALNITSTTPAPTGGPNSDVTGSTDPNITMTDPTHRHISTAATAGSGTPHTILSPIIAVNYIIKV